MRPRIKYFLSKSFREEKMLVLCVLLLMGCVSDQNSYNANLQNWVGMSQETLYESWGTPTNELYVGPNEKVVTYLQIDEDGPVNGNTEPYQGYEVQYGAIETPDYGFPSDNGGSYYCKTSFTIVNGEITDYTFNGDDCVANN